MPDCISSFGEPMAPEETITSRSARRIFFSPPGLSTISTPMARPFSTTMRVTSTSVRTVRFLRARIGLR